MFDWQCRRQVGQGLALICKGLQPAKGDQAGESEWGTARAGSSARTQERGNKRAYAKDVRDGRTSVVDLRSCLVYCLGSELQEVATSCSSFQGTTPGKSEDRQEWRISFARKSMIICGLSLDTDGEWWESQLRPELQVMIEKHRGLFNRISVRLDPLEEEEDAETGAKGDGGGSGSEDESDDDGVDLM